MAFTSVRLGAPLVKEKTSTRGMELPWIKVWQIST